MVEVRLGASAMPACQIAFATPRRWTLDILYQFKVIVSENRGTDGAGRV